MFLRWVCVSAVALCPCLACGCYCFSLILIKLLVLFFIMCLARVCYLVVAHLVWSYIGVLIHNVLVLTVRFTVPNLCMFIYCVHLSFVLWVMSYSSKCMSHWYIFVIWMLSISVALILPCIIPIVLVYSLLGLFICVVDLSSMRFNCFKFICVVAFLFLFLTMYWLVLHIYCTMLLWPLLIVHRWLLHPQRIKHLQRRQIREWKWTLTCSGLFPTLRDTRTSS